MEAMASLRASLESSMVRWASLTTLFALRFDIEEHLPLLKIGLCLQRTHPAQFRAGRQDIHLHEQPSLQFESTTRTSRRFRSQDAPLVNAGR
jgi:hypothetical protein